MKKNASALRRHPPRQNSVRRKGPSFVFCANPLPQLCHSVQAALGSVCTSSPTDGVCHAAPHSPSSGLVPQVLQLPCHKWVQQTSADWLLQWPENQTEPNWMSLSHLQREKSKSTAEDAEEEEGVSELPVPLEPVWFIWQDVYSMILHCWPL